MNLHWVLALQRVISKIISLLCSDITFSGMTRFKMQCTTLLIFPTSDIPYSALTFYLALMFLQHIT